MIAGEKKTEKDLVSNCIAGMDDFYVKENEKLHDRPFTNKLHYSFFLLGGVSCVLVFNCFLSMENFWTTKYGPNSMNKVIFGLNVGGITGFLSYPYISRCLAPFVLVCFAPLILLICSVWAIAIGELMVEMGNIKTLSCYLVAFLVGTIGSFLQCCLTTLSFKYGQKAISIFNGGFSLSGICTTAIAMMDLSLFTNSTVFEQAAYYEGFQMVATTLVMVVNILYFRAYPTDKFLPNGSAETEECTSQSPPPSLTSTFKQTYPLLFTMFFNFTVTMSFCPALLFAMGAGWKNEPMAQQIILMIFNLCDFLGKLLYTKYTMASTMKNHGLALSKISFLVVGCFATGTHRIQGLAGNCWITFISSSIFGILNGYLNCSLFHVVSLRVGKQHRSNAAYLCVVSLMLGFLYGSLCNLLGVID